MVHGLAAQLGGGFALISEPGEGTRVDLYLPVASEAALAERRPTRKALTSIGRQVSVLLIDDEPLVRTATAEMIRDIGHQVEEAGGGAEALARLEGGLSVDAVITDYMMPGMDGGTLSRRVLQIRPDLPVLLITGYTGPTEDVLHLPRLAKPFGQAEIAQALADLFAVDEKVVRFPGRKPSK